ncbi:hypothetical protein DPSP01_011729 [Paraphaeosphaeria sporulosa]
MLDVMRWAQSRSDAEGSGERMFSARVAAASGAAEMVFPQQYPGLHRRWCARNECELHQRKQSSSHCTSTRQRHQQNLGAGARHGDETGDSGAENSASVEPV